MSDVDFGHIITQDSTIVPDVYAVGGNIELVTLDGGAIQIREIAPSVWLIDETGTFTINQLKAMAESQADSTSDACGTTPEATALEPGSWSASS